MDPMETEDMSHSTGQDGHLHDYDYDYHPVDEDTIITANILANNAAAEDSETAGLASGGDLFDEDGNAIASPADSMIDGKPVYRRAILVTLSMFMGYASLVALQHRLKEKYGIKDKNDARSHEFSFAVSFLYIGNLIFRLAHNFVFSCVPPRRRVYIAMGCMMCSMFILSIFVFAFGWTGSLGWVYIAYAFGGVGIGSFESNLLSAITPLGHATKMWAILGFPLGFACILVLGFGLMAVGVPVIVVYLIVLGSQVFSSMLFAFGIPVVESSSSTDSLQSFFEHATEWREWLPPIVPNCLCLMVDMFCVSLFSGLMLYIFNNEHHVPLWGKDEMLVQHDWFFVFFNLFYLFGDSLSRKFVYWARPRHPAQYLIFCVVGALLCLTKMGFIAPLGIFCVFFANGGVYATSTRFIDTHIDKRYNLIALSVWLFVGDVGSVVGSNTLSYIRDAVCKTPQEYTCLVDT